MIWYWLPPWHRRHRPRRRISLGKPVLVNKEGKIVMAQYATNLTLYFPIKVNGAPPPSTDTFSVVPSNPAVFTAAIGVTPGVDAAGDPDPDAGLPAVITNALTLAGALGLSFVVNDGQGDLPATEDFDYIAPVTPPPPPGQIDIDAAGVQQVLNPNAPTS